ncbi:MAG: hypothetical protein WKG03_00260 [Telluria sp.]
MSPHFINDLVAVLGAIKADDGVKRQIQNGLFQVGRMHGVRDLNRMERHIFAAELLNQKVSRTTIAARLMSNFGIARRQAYRDIEEAFVLRHFAASNGTTREDDESIEMLSGVRDVSRKDQSGVDASSEREDCSGRADDIVRSCGPA